MSVIDLDACGLAEAIASGSVNAEEVLAEYLGRIEAFDPELHSFLEVHTEHAIERAREIDRRRDSGDPLGPLAGVPVALKDNLCLSRGHTTCASKILSGYQAPYTATAVERLEAAGAVVIGKTNMDEFAMGSSTESSVSGPTRNPWNRECVAGGSSGGSAAAVSAALTSAALGSDTGGSIRQPASFCGVVGMKPSYGRVSRYGLVAYASSLDQIGPVTASVRDAAAMLAAISGHDPLDTTSLDAEVPDYVSALGAANPPRVGVVREFARDLPGNAVEIFRAAGSRILEVELPHSRIEADSEGLPSSYAVACYYIVAMAEASSNLARYDGVHFGRPNEKKTDDIVDLYSRTRAEGFGEEVRRRVMLGAYTLSAGYYDAYYKKALEVRRLIREDFDRAFEVCDVLLGPTTPGPAFRIGEKTSDPLTMYLEDIYTISVNLAGLPAVSVPCGLSPEGLPLGVQIIGHVLDEVGVLRAAALFEREAGPLPAGPLRGGKDA